MKADKKAINKLSRFGKIAYYLGCFKYKEYVEESIEYPENIRVIASFTMRWWNPISLILVFIPSIITFFNNPVVNVSILRDK